MTAEFSKFKEEHVTSYILGELDGEAKSRVEHTMKINPEVRTQAQESKSFFDLLTKELIAETAPEFSQYQENALKARFEMASTAKGRAKMMFSRPFQTIVSGAQVAMVSAGAGVVTLALFFAMHALIKMDSGIDPKEIGEVASFDIVRPPEPDPIDPADPSLPIHNVTDVPPPPDIPIIFCENCDGTTEIVAPPIKFSSGEADPFVPKNPGAQIDNGSDMTAVPVFRVQPVYPIIAANQRIEGWVRLRFTITQTGAVRNPEVIESSPEIVFNKAAIAAIKKWKYKPKIVNGTAIETPNVQVKLNFELEDV